MSEDTPQHPREITLELIFRQGQRILGELGQIREKQDEIVTRLARVEREVVDLPLLTSWTLETAGSLIFIGLLAILKLRS
jgi:hypothetical protein